MSLLAFGTLPPIVVGTQILKTSGFSTCLDNSNLTVNNVDIEYNNDNKTVSFNVAGSSTVSMNVTAVLNVTAYGNSVYSNSFNPCNAATFVAQLCPGMFKFHMRWHYLATNQSISMFHANMHLVPAGSFSAQGVQAIPSQYASLIPAIAFQVPDIAAQATLELKATDGGQEMACITSAVSNGKTFSVTAVSYVAAGVAAAALVMAGVSAIGGAGSLATGAGSAAAGTISPSFVEVFTWFQGIAMNGMLSVNYPPIYRSFSKNFGFATGIIPWTQLQTSIDSFRSMTGGNLTDSNVQFLQNATLAYTDGSNSTAILKRGLADLALSLRDITTSVNSSTSAITPNSTLSQVEVKVSGIGAFVESLAVPQQNTFMTVLLVVAIVVAAIVVGVLLLKLILEGWALFASFPQSLAGFRKHYWGTMARSIVQLILILYGVWVLYCVFQFTHGDSWAAKALAAVTLSVFTGILVFFTFEIWQAAQRSKEAEGDVSLLYEDKQTWIKYSLFYDAYKKNFWWTFVPAIVYMFAKGCVLAAADGHGLVQTIAQLVIEGLMLILLVFTRPYERKSGNVINIFIQVVRALSVVCILVFVEGKSPILAQLSYHTNNSQNSASHKRLRPSQESSSSPSNPS
jgi:hypothetical protein